MASLETSFGTVGVHARMNHIDVQVDGEHFETLEMSGVVDRLRRRRKLASIAKDASGILKNASTILGALETARELHQKSRAKALMTVVFTAGARKALGFIENSCKDGSDFAGAEQEAVEIELNSIPS